MTEVASSDDELHFLRGEKAALLSARDKLQNELGSLGGRLKCEQRKHDATSRTLAATVAAQRHEELTHPPPLASARRGGSRAAAAGLAQGEAQSPTAPSLVSASTRADAAGEGQEPATSMAATATTITLTVQVYASNTKWIISSAHLRRFGYKVLDSEDAPSGIIDPNFGLHPVRHGSDGLPYLDGHFSAGRFTICARGPGTTEVLVDTGANVTATGTGWRDVLTLRPGPGQNAACPGSQSLVSAGQADLKIAFPAPTTFVHMYTVTADDLSCGVFGGTVISSIVQAHAPTDKGRKREPPSAKGRFAMIRSADVLHECLGITNPKLMRALMGTAVGVGKVNVDMSHSFVSAAFMEAASRRSPITGARLPESTLADANMEMGCSWSGDPTCIMPLSLNGNIYAFLFVELRSGLIFVFPMRDKTIASCIAAFEALERLVQRTFPGVQLRRLRLDCAPGWTKTNPTSSLTGPRNVAAFDTWLVARPQLMVTHAPPNSMALNPTESSMALAVYKMNFFLHQACLAIKWWEDMLGAAVAILNCLVRLSSRNKLRRKKSPQEIVYKRKGDFTQWPQPPHRPQPRGQPSRRPPPRGQPPNHPRRQGPPPHQLLPRGQPPNHPRRQRPPPHQLLPRSQGRRGGGRGPRGHARARRRRCAR